MMLEFIIVMLIAPTHAHMKEKKRGELKGVYGRIGGEEEGDTDYVGLV